MLAREQMIEKDDPEKIISPDKARYLKYIDTKSLIIKMHELENELEKLMKEEAEFKTHNYGYTGAECAEVKRIEAELVIRAEGSNENQRKAWLLKQRTDNLELLRALARQKVVAFEYDNLHIKLEMVKKRLEGIKAVLALKTAQLYFLAEIK